MKQQSEIYTISLRERNRERTRQEIIACALKLFQERGFENVSVEMICEQVGVSRATFFNYFPQKELIFGELSRMRLQFVRDFLREHAAKTNDGSLQDVLELFQALAAENEKQADLVKYVIAQTLQRPICLEHIAASRQEFESVLIHLLDNARRNGEKLNPHFTIETIVEFLVALYFATTLEWATLKDTSAGWLSERLQERLRLAQAGILLPEIQHQGE